MNIVNIGVSYSVGFDKNGGLEGKPLLLLNIVRHIAQLLFHNSDGLKVGRVIERIASEQQELIKSIKT